jgi:hypothetical protein
MVSQTTWITTTTMMASQTTLIACLRTTITTA